MQAKLASVNQIIHAKRRVNITLMSEQSKTALEMYIYKQKPVNVLITETNREIECQSYEVYARR